MNRYDINRKNFYEATSLREPEKVPVGVNMYGWAFHYAGVTYRDIVDDPVAVAREYDKFFQDVEVDCAQMVGLPWSVRTWKALGSNIYDFGADGNCVNHIQVNDQYLDEGIYDEIIADANGFINNTGLKRMYPIFQQPKEQAYASYIEALKEYKNYSTGSAMISASLREKGIFSITDDLAFMYCTSFLKFFDLYRGIVNSMVDLRRRKAKVYEACKAIDALKEQSLMFAPDALPKENMIGYTVYHPEGGFFNARQYDDLYFNIIKETYLPYLENGVKLYIYGEGAHMYTLDRFRQLPKGSIILHLDSDDPFQVSEKIGDWITLSCGITLDLLAGGTKEQCVDYVKKCFDMLAPGGGFIFAPNKTMCSSKDAKIENVIAVYETANELSRKH